MQFQKGQGAQHNPQNRFLTASTEVLPEYMNHLYSEGESSIAKTKYHEVFPTSIVNKVTSPDVGMDWSLNPYQGCEHGCTYCYARNSHEYWGYSAGVDFERTILVKKNAADLLAKTLAKKSWTAAPVVLSGNTDCYQPAERKFELTRQCLEVFWRYRHPVGIITKNAMILRDLDLIEKLHQKRLINVVISLTTLDEDLRRKMEPRTATAQQRLRTIKVLSDLGVPVTVMMGPVIPGLNSHEIFNLLGEARQAGAQNAHYTYVRLNGQIGEIFSKWLEGAFPDRAEKVLNHIRAAHNGQLRDSQFGRRMRGQGHMARQVADTFKLAKKKYFGNPVNVPLDCSLHTNFKDDQLSLF